MKVSNYPILQEVNDDIDSLCDLVSELRNQVEDRDDEIEKLKEDMSNHIDDNECSLKNKF